MSLSIEGVRMKFSKELEEMLIFEEYPELVIVRTRRFLGGDNFAKVAAIVRSLNGEYISNGTKSHFKVPRQQKGKAARVYSLTEKGQRYFEAIKKIRMILASLEDLEQLEKK